MKLFTKSVVGIEFHDRLAQFVELKQGRTTLSLESYNRMQIPEGLIRDGEIVNQEELKLVLKDFFVNANPRMPKMKHAALILPARITFVHIFKFPGALKENEIEKALPYQAETVIPFAISDVYWDFQLLDKVEIMGKTYNYVLFAAIPKKMAEAYAFLLEGLGITPYYFGINVEAMKHALEDQVKPKEMNMIIDLGAIATNYLIMEGDKVKCFFSSNKGTESMLDAMAKEFKVDEKFLHECCRQNQWEDKYQPSINSFVEKRYKQALLIAEEHIKSGRISGVDNVYLTGEFSNLHNSFEFAKEYFIDKKVFVGDPKIGMFVDEDRFRKDDDKMDQEKLYSVYFTNVFGIARKVLKETPMDRINLLPTPLKEKFTNRKKSTFIALGVLVMSLVSVFLASTFFFLHQQLTYERLHLEIQKSQVERTIFGTRYQEIQQALNDFNNEVSILSRIDFALISAHLTLEEIFDQIPDGIEMNSFRYRDSNLSLEISGIAETREDLVAFQQALEANEMVSEVVIPISSFDEKAQISFVISVSFNFNKLPPYAADHDR